MYLYRFVFGVVNISQHIYSSSALLRISIFALLEVPSDLVLVGLQV